MDLNSNFTPLLSPWATAPPSSSWFLIWLLWSEIVFRIACSRSNRLLFRFRLWPSILATSKMSSASLLSLFAFLFIASISSWYSVIDPSLFPIRVADKPIIGWMGLRSSWAAMLMNSFCIVSVFFNSSFSNRSFHSNSNIDLNDSTLRSLFE